MTFCRMHVRQLSVMLIALAAAPTAAARSDALPGPRDLAATWQRERLPLPAPPLVRHADVVSAIEAARRRGPDFMTVERIGESVEGRAIHHLTVGRGPLRVLLWSQMHGDEPTATVALFDVLEYLRARRDEVHVRRILDALTLHVVPMLNPDGAERFQRRNAQGIDINRDALRLQTPEGRTLKALRDRLNPAVGFNLHNQNWRTSVGSTGQPAAISLLSVAYDEARSEHEGRRLTKRLASVIRGAVETLAPGMVGRYDDEFEVRAFGDNLTKWGTSVLLIETGPYPGHDPDRMLVTLNYVALLTALDALATGDVHAADPSRYESLPMNGSGLFHTLVRNGTVVAGTGVDPFVADVGIAGARTVREANGSRAVGWSARIEDLGDLRVHGALETIDATGLLVAPLWDKNLREGAEVDVPASTGSGATIAPGQPARLVLLKPAATAGRHVVVRIVRVE